MNPELEPFAKAVMVRIHNATCICGRVLTRRDRQRSSLTGLAYRPRLRRSSDWISSPVSMEVAESATVGDGAGGVGRWPRGVAGWLSGLS